MMGGAESALEVFEVGRSSGGVPKKGFSRSIDIVSSLPSGCWILKYFGNRLSTLNGPMYGWLKLDWILSTLTQTWLALSRCFGIKVERCLSGGSSNGNSLKQRASFLVYSFVCSLAVSVKDAAGSIIVAPVSFVNGENCCPSFGLALMLSKMIGKLVSQSVDLVSSACFSVLCWRSIRPLASGW